VDATRKDTITDGNIRWYGAEGNGIGPYHVDFLDYHIDLTDVDSYGGILDGFLKLSGVLTRVKLPEITTELTCSQIRQVEIVGTSHSLYRRFLLDWGVDEGVCELQRRRNLTGKDLDTWMLRIRGDAFVLLEAHKSNLPSNARIFKRLGVSWEGFNRDMYFAEDPMLDNVWIELLQDGVKEDFILI
jgi:hypothetical protein